MRSGLSSVWHDVPRADLRGRLRRPSGALEPIDFQNAIHDFHAIEIAMGLCARDHSAAAKAAPLTPNIKPLPADFSESAKSSCRRKPCIDPNSSSRPPPRHCLPSPFPCRRLLAGDKPKMTVYKSPSCGCCVAWIRHMQEAGYKVETVDQITMVPTKKKARRAQLHVGLPYGGRRRSCDRGPCPRLRGGSASCRKDGNLRHRGARNAGRLTRAWATTHRPAMMS